jgi:hypothetical protein
LVDLEASQEQLNESVNLLVKEYPDNVDKNFGDTKHFQTCSKQSCSDRTFIAPKSKSHPLPR